MLFPKRAMEYEHRNASDTKDSMMDRDGDEIHLNETESSAGVKSQGVRVVLVVSLILIVVAMSAVWIIGSATR